MKLKLCMFLVLYGICALYLQVFAADMTVVSDTGIKAVSCKIGETSCDPCPPSYIRTKDQLCNAFWMITRPEKIAGKNFNGPLNKAVFLKLRNPPPDSNAYALAVRWFDDKMSPPNYSASFILKNVSEVSEGWFVIDDIIHPKDGSSLLQSLALYIREDLTAKEQENQRKQEALKRMKELEDSAAKERMQQQQDDQRRQVENLKRQEELRRMKEGMDVDAEFVNSVQNILRCNYKSVEEFGRDLERLENSQAVDKSVTLRHLALAQKISERDVVGLCLLKIER